MRLFSEKLIRHSNLQISWEATDNGLCFEPSSKDSFEEFIAQLKPSDFLSRSRWMLLSELIENGQAEVDGNSVIVSYDELARLGFSECDLLGESLLAQRRMCSSF